MNDDAATGAKAAPKHLYLIDGSGYIFRAFHAIPVSAFVRQDGVHTNAVNGFCNMIIKLLEQVADDGEIDHLAVIFDASSKTFRKDIYPDYKANREEPPEELRPQFALIREATRAFGLPSIELEGYEADDLIATYAAEAVEKGFEVTVLSSDKDLMQLVGEHVTMHDPMKDRRIGREQVIEKFGVGPEKVIEVQALAGDSSDNVPGVPGIGVKTAALLIGEYGDLETLLARAGEIKQPKRRQSLLENADLARISKELVTLKDDVPIDVRIEEFALRDPDPETLLGFLRAQEFRAITARIEAKFAAAGMFEPSKDAAPAKGEYELVQSIPALQDWIARAEYAGFVAFDTETNSLDTMQAELVGFSLSVEPGRGCYVPLGHTGAAGGELNLDGAARPEQIDLNEALALLRALLIHPGVLKIGHNIKYDMAVLARYDAPIAPVDDTMVLSFVLDAGRHGHGLDELAEFHLGHTNIKFSEVAGSGKKRISFDRVPLDKACDYAGEDADICLRLHRLLKPRLAAERMTTLYETIERPLIGVLVDMERAGIKADREELARLSSDFAQRIAVLEKEIHALAGHDFTIGSPKQLGEVLFGEMGLEGAKKSAKTGAYSTGADVLEGLAAEGHALPAKVLDWRHLAKLKSTYTDALIEQIDPGTGRVHTSYGMAGAATGRLSSSDPNLQNIPVRTEEGRKIRRAFIAEPGNKLVSLDYSQIELRLLAHVAEVPALTKAFKDGVDIHALTASEVFGVPIEGMDPMVRRQAKAINFGIIYGISAFGLANQLGIERGEAAAYIEAYFARYPGIRDYMEAMKETARELGYVSTLFHRRIHLPEIKSKNPARRAFQERAAINAPLQGGAADIIKRAMARVPTALDTARLDAKMLLQVHDELLFEVPEAQVEESVSVVSRVMERATLPALELKVPLVVDAGVADNWAEAH
ncbi:MAG: DNA polymerase I [Alphaproteobacteria bacterium]